jgi:hypothetical protein
VLLFLCGVVAAALTFSVIPWNETPPHITISQQGALLKRATPIPGPPLNLSRSEEEGSRVPLEFLGGVAELSKEEDPGTLDEPDAVFMRGQVLDAGTLQPLRDHSVIFLCMAETSVPAVVGTTDAEGNFTVRIPYGFGLPGDSLSVYVRESEDTLDIYRGVMSIATSVEILVPARRTLHGQILPVVGTDAVVVAGMQVRLDGTTRSGGRLYLGREALDIDGRFTITCRPQERIDSVSVTVADQSGILGVLEANMAQLCSRDGAELTLPLRSVDVSVVTSAGDPVPEASLVIGPDSVDANWVFSKDLGSDSGAVFLLEPGQYAYAVKAPGYRTVLGSSTFDVTEIVVMELLDGKQISVSGIVVDTMGSPVGDAFVYANLYCRNQEVGIGAAHSSAYSNRDGRFSLSVPFSATYDIGASHKLLGPSPVGRVHVGEGQELTIVISDSGGFRVSLMGDAQGVSFDGAVEYRIMNEYYDDHVDGVWMSPPYEIEQIPEGEYVILLHVPSFGLFGTSRMRVEQDEMIHIEVDVRAPPLAFGRVVSSNGEPAHDARLVVPGGGEFAFSPESWLETRSDGSGRFELPVLGLEDLSTSIALRVRLPQTSAHVEEFLVKVGEELLLESGETAGPPPALTSKR